MDLADECILVTGASGNLGAAVTRALSQRGAKVVCVDRRDDNYASATKGLDPDRLLLLAGYDLTSKDSAEAAVAEATARFGTVTGLVNTVGGFRTGRVLTDALDQWDTMMTLNAKVALITSIATLPALQAAGHGSIIHIAGQPGVKSGAGQAAYGASKAAVIRLVESLAAEHRKDRISVNCILPGTIDTPPNRDSMPDLKADQWIAPASIAELIAFLVSPQGAVVTGGAIPATGLV